MNSKIRFRRPMALLLSLVLCVGLVPSAFAAQQNSYHDPAEHWQEALNRTNELDANSVVTRETFDCCVCDKATAFEVFRVPEYTRNGETALTRNVKYSDGTCLDGESKGDLLDGTPGQDAVYTGYHWTKAVCEVCGTINSNMGATSYACNKNVYWLYDCATDFFEALPESKTIEQADRNFHRVITTSGEYCAFCYGTYKEESSTLERHHVETAIRPELAHDRFVEMAACADCGYAETAYTAAKSVVADYFGVVDRQPHTVTVSDLSEAGVTTAIRYGNSADACTLTSAPNYTEAGDYAVYYEITYTYKNTDMVEDGVAYVHLRDESTKETDGDGSCGEDHNWTLLDSVDPTCLTLGYDRYLCVDCGKIEKRDYEAALGHAFQSVVIRDATCEGGGKTVHICEGCGSSFVTDYTDPLGHSWGEGTEITGSTCTGEGVIEYRCVRCGATRLEGDAAAGHIPGEAATCTTPRLCTKCGAVIVNALGHDYQEEVTAPTCTEMGYTTYTCSRCGDTYKGDYTDAAGHKPGDWIIDQEPTTDSEGSKHKECTVCGKTLETAEIEKIYKQATTDTHGEAVVGGYLVIVTDTDTKNPVAGATVTLHEDESLSIRLPSGRLLDYADQTTIQVQLVKDKSPVAGMGISVTDRNDNFSSGKTDATGQLTVPGGSDTTNEDGKGAVGWEDADGDRWTLTVKVEDHETGRPIEDAGVSIGKTGTITVTLPDGTDMDEDNRITVTVTDQKREPQEGLSVIIKGDLGQKETGETDENGKLTVPAVVESEYHGAYVVGYTDGTFWPDRDMTRSEAATIFARLLAQRNGERITAPTKTTFPDVPTDAWYAGYVSYMARYGIAVG